MTTSTARRNIHPFPARMAPDIALNKISELARPGQRVLDPMCGSGTVVRLAADAGCIATGTDMDPLAVILTRTATSGSWSRDLEQRAREVVRDARRLSSRRPGWIAADPETASFVEYWFASGQADDLSRVARVLANAPRTDDPLRAALSRLIVTKDGGASLARDTAHSRPHRTRLENDFDVFDGFMGAAKQIAKLMKGVSPNHRPAVRRSDARHLGFVERASIDLVMTSPPYLNAIDYLRGHRMSLVWLGWTVSQLRTLRGQTVGAERGLAKLPPSLSAVCASGNPRTSELAPRHQRLVYRFTQDVSDFCRATARVVKPGGNLVLVVADSQLGGVPVSNSGICSAAACHHGFELADRAVREIPARHRYLPPPGATSNALGKRMKEEIVFTFRRAVS